MADIRDVTAGERSSADWSNQVKNAATRALPLDPVPSVRTQIEIYELTGDPTWDSDWELWTAKAKQVGIQLVGTDPQYVMQTDYPEEDVWFVTSSLTTDEEYEATTPSFATGSWVHTYKRWGQLEVVSGAGAGPSICTATLKGALAATDATATVDNVVPMGGGRSPLADPEDMAEELTVTNPLNPSDTGGFAGADNTVCKILWDFVADSGDMFDAPCPA